MRFLTVGAPGAAVPEARADADVVLCSVCEYCTCWRG